MLKIPFRFLINRDALDIFLGYVKLTSAQELLYDVLVSLLFSTILVILSSIPSHDIESVLAFVNQNIGTAITALSILAGFNITSITVIATSQTKISQILKENKVANGNESLLEQVINFFCWAILIQLTALFISIIAVFLFKFGFPAKNDIIINLININFTWLNLLWAMIFLGTWFVTYSILLTIRNVSILYYYLISNVKS